MKLHTTPPKGMRDHGPASSLERKYIQDTITHVFVKYGFLPLETPAMEHRATLVGQYGGECEKLIFQVLNSGDYLQQVRENDPSVLSQADVKTFSPQIADKALRYDLTIPLARYVSAHWQHLPTPFKRYQIQPVWRADRPQKGRYREFMQCDVDIIGSESRLCEVEMLLIIDEVFRVFGLTDYKIHINHRAFLSTIARKVGVSNRESEFLIILDKYDRIGIAGVVVELRNAGFSEESIKAFQGLEPLLRPDPTFKLLEQPEGSSLYRKYDKSFQVYENFREIRHLISSHTHLSERVYFAPLLTRGIGYYTGIIFEVKYPQVTSSLLGGGRYDNLTGRFLGEISIPGVGISFGVDRMHEIMKQHACFPPQTTAYPQILVANLGPNESVIELQITQQLRAQNVRCEYYTDVSKVKKQITYAERKHIPYMLFVGEHEFKVKKYGLKELETGKQEELSVPEIVDKLQNN